MSRKQKYKSKLVMPDRVYNNKLVTKIYKFCHASWKKIFSRRACCKALMFSLNLLIHLHDAFVKAIDEVSPKWKLNQDVLVVQHTRFLLKSKKKILFPAMKWIIDLARKKI